MLRMVAVALLLATPAMAVETVRTEAAGLRFAVPKAWTRVPAPSDVRAAQWKISGKGGEDGELVLFFFGKGKGGSAQENLERWFGQFTQPDGRPSRDAAVTTIRTVNGLRVTSVDLAGAYRGSQMGGGAAAQPRPGSRMLAAVVEGEDGPWFFKAVGPDATIAETKSGFDAMLGSVEAHR
jgi:hypothetical protein